jgi:hypothetical protein
MPLPINIENLIEGGEEDDPPRSKYTNRQNIILHELGTTLSQVCPK